MSEINFFTITHYIVPTYIQCVLLVTLTGYFAVTNQVSIDAVDDFVKHLRFPLSLIYKMFTQGEPKRYLWNAVNIGFPCDALIGLPICFFILIFFSLVSLLGIISGINAANGVRFLINCILMVWIIGGSIAVFLIARQIKNFDTQKPKRRKRKNSEH